MRDQYAVATAFALNSKHSQGSASSSHSIDLGLKLLDRLGCTLRGPLNYQGPLVALLHGVNKDDLMSGSVGSVRRTYMRYQFVNVTDDLYTYFSDVLHQRAPNGLHLPTKITPQWRRDGWATVLKLFAWRLVEYSMVLLVDLDVLLVETPQPFLERAVTNGVVFHAAVEDRTGANYTGVRTHLVLLRPSMDTFAMLMSNAIRGHWLPYTLTEQDVIETAFPPLVLDDWKRLQQQADASEEESMLPEHEHWGFVWFPQRKGHWSHLCNPNAKPGNGTLDPSAYVWKNMRCQGAARRIHVPHGGCAKLNASDCGRYRSGKKPCGLLRGRCVTGHLVAELNINCVN